MPDFSGTYTAKTESQTTVNGPGNHQIGLAVACGPQKRRTPIGKARS